MTELRLAPQANEALIALAERQSLEQLEALALSAGGRRALSDEVDSSSWREFVTELRRAWSSDDYAIVRALPVNEGATTLLAALALDAPFRTYRGDKVVKHFKMSPWTKELSHTLREGHFHTDLNTADNPPQVTMIHCRVPDPREDMGMVHVARLGDLLAELRHRGAEDTLRFLLDEEVQMVDERSWTGVMANEETIRFHPETLRVAKQRGVSFGGALDLERHLALIQDVALAVSTPISLRRGDALFVSNTRALHYRGACSVRFVEFPRRFEAREIFVLHLRDEPTWPD